MTNEARALVMWLALVAAIAAVAWLVVLTT
jgi:hypothetical protein